MRTRFGLAIAGAVLSVALAGCTSLAQVVAETATRMSSSASSDVTTLADAELAADVVVKAAKTAVDTNTLSPAQLTELQKLRAAVRSALDDLEQAQAKGQALDFALFNASIDAYNTYATAQGIPH